MEIIELNNKECLFEYRNSIIKKEVGRYIVLSAKFSNKNKIDNIDSLIELTKNRIEEKVCHLYSF